MPTLEEAEALVSPLVGKPCSVSVDHELAEIWSTDPGQKHAIRFYESNQLHALLLEYYEDYLREHEHVDAEGRWLNTSVVPFATVGGEHRHDDLEFFNDSFVFLFWDLDGGEVLSATTEEWDLSAFSFEDLSPFLDSEAAA